MKPELVAYLVDDKERVWPMPTADILVALDPLLQASSTPSTTISCDHAACYAFLQAVKLTMRASSVLGDPADNQRNTKAIS